MKICGKIISAISIGSLGLVVGGCASITRGTTQAITVSSSPAGADVRLDGSKVGQTPMSFEAKRKSDHMVTIEKAGYDPFSVAITRSIGGAVFGNYLFAPFTLGVGALAGWGADAASGAQYNLTPAMVSVTLKETTADAQSGSVTRSAAAALIDELQKLDDLHEAKKISDEEYAKTRASLVGEYSAKPSG